MSVPLARIRSEIERLACMGTTVAAGEPADGRRKGRRPDCYLDYGKLPGPGLKARALGPYAKWLLAVDLLADGITDPSTPITALIGLDDALKSGQRCVKRAFGQRDRDEALALAARYRVTDLSAIERADRDAARVHHAIVDRLNLKLAPAGRRPITVQALLDIQVPVDAEQPVVGHAPLAAFTQWLRWGTGAPRPPGRVPAAVADRARQAGGEFLPRWHSLRGDLVGDLAADHHRRIINLHSEAGSEILADFAAVFCDTLGQAAGGAPGAGAAERVVPVFQVGLGGGATRVQVLQQLYQAFGLPAEGLAALQQGLRPIDLAADLAPVREALTVNRVVVLFDGWANATGTFDTLQAFLCNTHWGEFLRILAQPRHPQVMAAGGRQRPESRLVVLSTHPARELAPWVEAIRLDEVWRSHRAPAQRLAPALRDWLQARGPGLAPSGLEAALLPGLGPAALQAWADDHPARWQAAGCAPDARWRADTGLMCRWLEARDLSLAEQLAIRLVAASVNGMRRSTLLRCAREWAALFGPPRDALAVPGDLLKTLQQKCLGVLQTVADEELELLSATQRELELNQLPVLGDAADDIETGQPRVLVFASDELRAQFVAAWLDLDAEAPPAPGRLRPAPMDSRLSWAHVNFVLAEESIRQASTQFRHRTDDGHGSPHVLRRAIQGLVHGLASLGLPASAFGGGAPVSALRIGLHSPALPTDPHKRYRYLYRFLYRHVIEGDQWRISRSFGQSRLRLDILTLLVDPGLAPRILTGQHDGAAEQLLPAFPLAGRSGAAGAPLPVAALGDRRLWCDLVEAVGRAGCDLGGARGGQAVNWALERLPHGQAPAEVHAMLPARGPRYYAVATEALKLRIDWYQSRGDEAHLAQAEVLCWGQLGRLGLARARIEGPLFEAVTAFFDRPPRGEAGGGAALVAILDRAQGVVERGLVDRDAREAASDMLFRLGEILATRADDQAGGPARGTSRHTGGEARVEAATTKRAFGHAFAVYWVADRLRSGIGGEEDARLAWPRASARAMRYYIRVVLKLAGLLAQEHPAEGSGRWDLSTQLLAHAQGRIGVYTRHHFQFRRERDSMLLLEASRLRAWSRIVRERQIRVVQAAMTEYRQSRNPASAQAQKKQGDARRQYAAVLGDQHRLLEGCWGLIEKAEALLFSLGFQSAHVRRLLLERIKTGIAFVHLGLSYDAIAPIDKPEALDRRVQGALVQAESALQALADASSGQAFWRQIIDRQQQRLSDAQGAWRRALDARRPGLSAAGPGP